MTEFAAEFVRDADIAELASKNLILGKQAVALSEGVEHTDQDVQADAHIAAGASRVERRRDGYRRRVEITGFVIRTTAAHMTRACSSVK
ncbi:hypothetical protein [Nonomuraea guangzhouensis]|uniref:Uncharacterized protein n=1 Tax=Nonomuraea guangzhouensis TaxID=1291555 RepID=A0ABW4GY55_9ACTN|nr:hypothetical protein [Nonomuraea guangzhouensis]